MKKSVVIYSIIVFVLLAIFFIVLHPIAIFDTDDWSNIHHLRLPIPIINAWNPIKVFPEVFMSAFSYAGAYLLYPITGRYSFSLSVSNGLFICFAITIYFVEFLLLICKKYSLSMFRSIMISAVFICLHFLIVLHPGKDNVFLFYAYDLTCIYHYTLSTIINSALVMHMIRVGGFYNFRNLSRKHQLLVIAWTYLAIFSSLYTNIIITVYIGVELLFVLISDLKNHQFKLNSYCSHNKPHLIILVTWFCSLIIEQTGGRSSGHESNFLQSFQHACLETIKWAMRFNNIFLILSIITVIFWIIKAHNKNLISFGKYLIAFLLTTLYIVLLSAVVDSTYVGRIDVFFASLFWLLLILMMLFCELITTTNFSDTVLAIIAILLFICTASVNNNYKEINYVNIPYEQCEALVDDIISQFKTAEQNNETEIKLFVPAFDTENNWPYGTYATQDFTKVMFRHKIIQTKITVSEMIPSVEKTQKYINY